jgi:hypothetical protein
MIGHDDVRTALRTRIDVASAFVAASTGSTTLSATTTGYARAAGSFLTDGFRDGMELLAAGFTDPANNGTKVITAVSATTIDCDGCAVEGAAAARSLLVGPPSSRAWENEKFDPVAGVPYMGEALLGGPATAPGLLPGGWLENDPSYALQFFAPAESGRGALDRYTDAALRCFYPGLGMPLPTGEVLRVRGRPAPFKGVYTQAKAGFTLLSVTVPLWVYSLIPTT